MAAQAPAEAAQRAEVTERVKVLEKKFASKPEILAANPVLAGEAPTPLVADFGEFSAAVRAAL